MNVSLKNISKRYLYEWIIKDFSHDFASNSITGINGINGSGKSTLIKMISGFLSVSEGAIEYQFDKQKIERSDVFQYVSIAAPYTDIIQEYDVFEMFAFHKKMKRLRSDYTLNDFLDLVNLTKTKGKAIKFYSSGMKQRLQLALAVLSDTSLLLLDEPTSYLDMQNKRWFYTLLKQNLKGRTTIIASNDAEDFQFCKEVIDLQA